jgi:prepilin-type N-terminal cleavage/methylation domain-containing protein
MRLTRRGFALVELLAALVISAVLGAALLRLVDRSARFTRGVALMADQRAQLAVASFAVQDAMLGIAATDGDLRGGADSSVMYLANVGSAVACAVAGSAIELPPSLIASGATLAWWNTTPQPGDSLVILDDGVAAGAADDRWYRGQVAAIAPLPDACRYTPLLDSIADAGRTGWRMTVAPTLPATVAAGAPVRVLRPERFALYRSSGEWTLGWTEWNAGTSTWNVIQPVAGPLLPYAPAPATSGAAFTWRDSLGGALAASPAVTPRVLQLTLGALTRQAVRVDGVPAGMRRDSLMVRIPLRNAR